MHTIQYNSAQMLVRDVQLSSDINGTSSLTCIHNYFLVDPNEANASVVIDNPGKFPIIGTAVGKIRIGTRCYRGVS